MCWCSCKKNIKLWVSCVLFVCYQSFILFLLTVNKVLTYISHNIYIMTVGLCSVLIILAIMFSFNFILSTVIIICFMLSAIAYLRSECIL